MLSCLDIKEPLLLIRKSSPCSGSSRFPVLLSEWSFTVNKNVLEGRKEMFYLTTHSTHLFSYMALDIW